MNFIKINENLKVPTLGFGTYRVFKHTIINFINK